MNQQHMSPRQARSLIRTIQTADGRHYTLRALQEEDGDALSQYFESLSFGTRSLYGPHPFDRKTALELVAEKNDEVLRFVAVDEDAEPPCIVSYWILSLQVHPGDAARYTARLANETGNTSQSEAKNARTESASTAKNASTPTEASLQWLPPGESCSIAPSVRDDLQSKGIGSAMMTFVVDIARSLGKRRMILQGGVQERNTLARHFYEKHGFLRAGEFKTTITDIDMVLPL